MQQSSILTRRPRVCDARPPLPPVSAYEDYLSSNPTHANARRRFDARQLRVIANARRSPCNFAEIGRMMGCALTTVQHAYDKLPEHLK